MSAAIRAIEAAPGGDAVVGSELGGASTVSVTRNFSGRVTGAP